MPKAALEPAKIVADPKPAEKKVDTAAIEKWGEGFVSREKPPESAEDKKKREDAEKLATKPAEKPAPRKKPAPAVAAPTPSLKEVVTEVVTALKPVVEPPKPDKKVEVEFSADDKRRIANLEHLEKIMPEKYKGIAEKYKTSAAKLAEYADEWEKANPGREFVEGDDEHKAFYDANNVDWEDDDYIEAVADLRSSKATEKTEKRYQEEISGIKQRERLAAELPKVEKVKVTAARSFFSDLGEAFKDIVGEDGSLTEKFKSLEASNPVAHSIAITEAAKLEAMTAETYKLFNGLETLTAENPLHRELNSFIFEKEKKMLSKPVEEQANEEGKPFKSAEDYWKLPEAERKNYWTFGQSDIDYLLVRDAAKKAKQLLQVEEEKFTRQAKARGITLPDSKPAENEKPISPTSAPAPRIRLDGKRGDESDAQSVFKKRMLGLS